MNKIINKNFDAERALYGSDGLVLRHCSFDGPADGESALKGSRNIETEDCFFNLRYPFWHDGHIKIVGSEMTELCRAALWYFQDIEIADTRLHGIKALRECTRVMYIVDGNIKGEYDLSDCSTQMRERERALNNWLLELGW